MPHKSSLLLRMCSVPQGTVKKRLTQGLLQLHYRVLLPESNWGGVTESGGSSEGTFNPPSSSQQLSSQTKFQALIKIVNLTHFVMGNSRNMALLLKQSSVSTATVDILKKHLSAQIFSGFIPLHPHLLNGWLTPWPSSMETRQQLLVAGPRQAHLKMQPWQSSGRSVLHWSISSILCQPLP